MSAVPAESDRRPGRAAPAARRREPVQLRSRRRIETILDVTAALVDELGPGEVTTTVIAERAGISVGSIYAYFEDRSAIFNAIVERSILKHEPLVERIRRESRSTDWFAIAGDVIDAIVELYRREPGFRALYFSSHLSAEMLATMRRSDELQAERLLARLADQQLEITCEDPHSVMRLYVGLIDKGMELAFSVHPDGDDRMIAETKRAVRNYLGPYLATAGEPPA